MSQPRVENFSDLVRLAAAEPDPALLLTVLVRAEPAEAGEVPGKAPAPEGAGILKPIMVKSHGISRELEFTRLASEADELDPRWSFMMLAILPGQDGRPPAPPDVDESLKMMARTLLTGGDLGRYLFIDRQGELVQVGTPVDLVRSGSNLA